ncbi:site-specific integrase [Cryobacterium zongtaii]|uniref:Site-specific integrase n=1 Tax=Cryobacterium zongtaii TaxID=1259217 RepID=A0A2S3Z5G6_9MICO|nr:site-specific integrase [Cryobacterium zongtaii]POH59158.1 site-specific integrase [Cryobacterium zongtaii]
MAGRLTKRLDNRYTVTLTLDGKRRFFYGKTQAEAKGKADEARARVKAGGPVRDATRMLTDWLNEWTDTYLALSDRAESTKIMHAGYVRTWISPTIGRVPLGSLTGNDVNRMLLAMKAAGKAESTRRNCYTTLRKALDDAVSNGLLAANPAHKIRQPGVNRNEARFLTATEVGLLLQASQTHRYEVVIRFILGTGLRRGEALALRWSDIDLDDAHAKLRGSLTRRGSQLVVSGVKTKASRRTIALSPAMVRLLRQHKAAQAKERLRAGNRWRDHGMVFATADGALVEPQNILRTVREAAIKAGLEPVTVHSLRHTYATAALLNGVALKVVSANLGHASIQITADTYGHVTDDAARAGAVKVAEALGL